MNNKIVLTNYFGDLLGFQKDLQNTSRGKSLSRSEKKEVIRLQSSQILQKNSIHLPLIKDYNLSSLLRKTSHQQ